MREARAPQLGVQGLAVEEDDAVVALEWARAPGGAETKLLKEVKRQLESYFTRKLKTFDLPMSMKGSDFQRAVWDRMNRIPYGKTVTYGMVARELESGPRAVGMACGTNPIAVAIPCHRVLAAGGRMGGYSGGNGLETKRELLQHEGVLR